MTLHPTLRSLTLALLAALCLTAGAQRQAHLHSSHLSHQWDFPLATDSIDTIDLGLDPARLLIHLKGGSVVPFSAEFLDSLTVSDTPAVETKDPYQVFQLYITTDDGRPVTSRDYYTGCHLLLNGRGAYSNQSLGAEIRGRGNSSWLWYDKKPYRLKLYEKHKLLGLAKAKSWVLLANYRDVTDLMNTFVFEMGHYMGLPYTNHTRYVELFINGDYQGLYQLTEQVQQNKNRVNVSDERGILIALDVDDGPTESPYADDNFTSKVFRMPVCVKYPDDERFTANTVDSVRTVFAQLEQAIKDKDYERTSQLLDIRSFIDYLLIQEFVYNVELSAPRSIFIHKDGDGPWVMGPLWDFDAGYDFDWGDMYNGHTFFTDFSETVMGTDPLRRNGQYAYVPQFFTNLFACPQFVEQYKARWAEVKDHVVDHAWTECMRYVANLRLEGAVGREASRWPLRGKQFDTELQKMEQWLRNRLTHMTYLIQNIPMPTEPPATTGRLCGTVTTGVAMDWNRGYQQRDKIHVSKDDVLRLMELSADELNEANLTIVPLMDDGSEGQNGTNGVFGGWFDADGNPGPYANGHVYIEVFDDLWNWNCGLYQQQCWDNRHTVVMQYQYPHRGTLLKVNVEVSVTISGHGWW